MKTGQRLWTRDELILTINLYCKIPFGRMHAQNPQVIALAKLIGRTAGSVAYKLVNLASLDPGLQARGIKGASNASKLDKQVWSEFSNNWEDLPFESEMLLAKYNSSPNDNYEQFPEQVSSKQGLTKDQLVKVRVNQAFFRSTILASYNETCCITGLKYPELLVAGHIKPWSEDIGNRMNPRNGVAMNALHDKAFELGLITITPDYRIKISGQLKHQSKSKTYQEYFYKFENKKMVLPSRFLPEKEFLEYHNVVRFIP